MYRRILAEIKEYKRTSILASLSMVGEVIFEILLPFLMSFIIDRGVSKGNMQAVLFYGLIMIICAFASLACGRASAKFGAYASAGLAKNLRKALFEKVQGFSFANIDLFSPGGLVTRMMTDVTNVQNAYQMLIRVCVRAPLNLIFAIIITFIINAQIAQIFIYVAIFLAIVLVIIIKFSHPLFVKVFDSYDRLNSSVQENITNMRVIKSYVKEDYETKKFKKGSQTIYDMFMKAINIVIFNSPAMQLSMYITIIAISWIGAKLIVANQFTTGELTSMFTYTMTILMSLMMISMIFVIFTMAIASIERIDQVLTTKSLIVSPKNGIKEVADGSIEFKDVNFGYDNSDQKLILSNINFKINSGEVIGILGGTGSGKTSLVQLISRLYDVSKGTVEVGGVNVKDYDLDSLRKQVAMVLQTNTLFTGTIKENMRWGNKYATDEEIVAACKISQADEFISQFKDGYDTMIERDGANVSGGQRQRLCIARALLKNPKVLILDDSTSAVDTKTDHLIREGFATSLKDTTKIIISQRISSVEDADRIIVLDDGKINGVGNHEELLQNNKIYQEVYTTQQKGGQEDE